MHPNTLCYAIYDVSFAVVACTLLTLCLLIFVGLAGVTDCNL